MDKKFSRAFVCMHTSHDFSSLRELCDSVLFLSSGFEKDEDLVNQIDLFLRDFNPEEDIIVPVGRVAVSLVVGSILNSLGMAEILIANYQDKTYTVTPLRIG